MQIHKIIDGHFPDKTFAIMEKSAPQYLLTSHIDRQPGSGHWRFVLKAQDGDDRFEAEDVEPDVPADRLELLLLIRALETLDQPSKVTLVDSSDYVWKGVLYGLPEWRANGWRWEFFGQMVPVKNCDLWQRLDRALRFHDVCCRKRRFDAPQAAAPQPHSPPFRFPLTNLLGRKNAIWGLREKLALWLKYAAAVMVGV
jgi:ribonuclease HI